MIRAGVSEEQHINEIQIAVYFFWCQARKPGDWGVQKANFKGGERKRLHKRICFSWTKILQYKWEICPHKICFSMKISRLEVLQELTGLRHIMKLKSRSQQSTQFQFFTGLDFFMNCTAEGDIIPQPCSVDVHKVNLFLLESSRYSLEENDHLDLRFQWMQFQMLPRFDWIVA